MRLKELRNATGLNQTETANLIGIPRLNYNKYELETVEPSIETLCQIADYYNVTLDYLCEHETKGQILDLSSYDETKKGCIYLINKLNNTNSTILLGYITHMIQSQNN